MGRFISLSLIAALLLLQGCSQAIITKSRVRAPYSVYQPSLSQAGEFTPQQERWRDSLCCEGMPENKSPDWTGPTKVIVREGYALEHMNFDRVPLWVCERLRADQLDGALSRSGSWKPDPELDEEDRAVDADYSGSGYQRGHQAPDADQTTDLDLKHQTYYLSNAVPQLGKHNGGVWQALEGKVRDWAREFGDLYVITGPMFYEPEEDSQATADGIIDVVRIGKNSVIVPTHLFKVVIRPVSEGEYQAIGFVIPHNESFHSPYDWNDFVVSIRWIENRTGLDFMPELATAEATSLETTTPTVWE